ncbi:MAG: arginine--tRNA ligase [Candidatus Omnitrophota bacterium]
MLGTDIAKNIEKLLLAACREYFHDNIPGGTFPEGVDVSLQVTREAKHGDLTSNVAMRLASIGKVSPAVLGGGLIEILKKRIIGTSLERFILRIELAGGFLNFTLVEDYYHGLLRSIRKEGRHFGRSVRGKGKKVNLEFVSANPTGPLTVAHGRQAAIGDALARILRYNGFDVTCEYYLNDMGRQINLLGESVRVRYLNLLGGSDAMPEDGYIGAYITDIARDISGRKGKTLKKDTPRNRAFFRKYAVDHMMGLIRDDLKDFGVRFGTWTAQSGIEKKGRVEKTLGILEKKGYIYDQDGAKWFASTRLGDDKDRVVMKSDGSYTYLAPDIAYHLDKYSRGYGMLIDILGPDHHGYIGRMKAAVQALGYDKKDLNILIVQLVTLLRGGETVSMSTRKGEFISLRELIDELGRDVTRFFFLSRRLDSHLDFDIDLAKEGSSENPVFYMQYAHARICSIKKFSRREWKWRLFGKTDLSLLTGKEEKSLMRKLSEFPFVVIAGAEALEPNKVITYLNELSRSFHSFYTECRVVTEDRALSSARLYLVECVRIALANGLNLLNITLPEKM